jgi:hypothetical protein
MSAQTSVVSTSPPKTTPSKTTLSKTTKSLKTSPENLPRPRTSPHHKASAVLRSETSLEGDDFSKGNTKNLIEYKIHFTMKIHLFLSAFD